MLGLKKVLSRPKVGVQCSGMALPVPISIQFMILTPLVVFFCPQRSDKYPLSIFFYCDNAVTQQMRELNHLMQSSPNNLDRRATLIRQLKEAQHNLVNVVVLIMNQVLPRGRTVNKDFRAKYPDDVLLDQINGKPNSEKR